MTHMRRSFRIPHVGAVGCGWHSQRNVWHVAGKKGGPKRKSKLCSFMCREYAAWGLGFLRCNNWRVPCSVVIENVSRTPGECSSRVSNISISVWKGSISEKVSRRYALFELVTWPKVFKKHFLPNFPRPFWCDTRAKLPPRSYQNSDLHSKALICQ